MSLKSRIAKVEQLYSQEQCNEIMYQNHGNQAGMDKAKAEMKRLGEKLAELRKQEAEDE